MDVHSACDILFSSLIHRGYSLRKLNKIKRDTLWSLTNKITTHLEPNNPSPRTISTRSNPPPNADINHSPTPFPITQPPLLAKGSASPCRSKRCSCCKHVPGTKHITSSNNGMIFPLKDKLNCLSSNIIYVISCSLCHKQYVGETGRTLRQRLNNHRSNIGCDKGDPVADHFNLPLHNLAHITICPIQQLQYLNSQHSTRVMRVRWEGHWKTALSTISPDGLNLSLQTGLLNPIPLVLPYSPTATRVASSIRESYTKLQDRFPHVYSNRLITAYSRNPNLKDMIVSSNLPAAANNTHNPKLSAAEISQPNKSTN